MTDRYRGYPAAGRSATFNNPARISLPAVGGYGALYANDPDYVASPTRYSAATPRGYTAAAPPASVPPRSYSTVNPEPRAPRPGPREPSRNRRSTLDASARPPIIVTTMQDHRPHTSGPHTADVLAAHRGSPVLQDTYRSSDGRLYSQPASSIRSRSTARPYHTSSASDDFGRSREQGEIVLASRDADAYRNSRPHVVYPSNSRHSNAAIDYGDDGYQYTNAGELVRYDLDHGAAPAPARSRRHDSFDRAYSRPNINYNADQRSFNVNTTLDPTRANRPYDSRGGPPPSTRGFDKIGRAYENVPPAAPAPPNPNASGPLDVVAPSAEQRTIRRPRPLSLTQEPGARGSHPDDYYRGYDDDGYEPRRFYDDSVTARGFGLRVQPDDIEDPRGRYYDQRDDHERDDSARRDHSRKRIEAPVEEGRRPHGEEDRGSDREREDWYRNKDNLRERLDGRRDADQEDSDRSRVREKVASAGAAATATAAAAAAAAASGLSPNAKKEEMPEPSSPRRRRASDESEGRDEDRERQAAKSEAEARDRNRRSAETKLNGDSVAVVSSDSDEGKKKTARRHRPSHSFDPNDTGDLRQIREQLAAVKASDSEKPETNGKDRASPPAKEDRRSESPPAGEDNRGRDLVLRSPEEKQVRVVSPPREKKEDKPLKGILKQPSAKFPEELNPIREGVAPHKEDKKLKEVPPGARWTKINRKIVNPEALEIGKERFELRDDFVIVLRVLSKEEIQAYAAATQVLRERRRNKESGGDHDSDRDRDRESHGRDHERDYDDRDYDREYGREYDREYDQEYDKEYDDDRGRRGSHRHRRHRDDLDVVDPREPDRDRDRDRDRERRRRHRRDDDDEYESRSRGEDHHHHHRSHREA